MIEQQHIEQALAQYRFPYLGQHLLHANVIRHYQLDGLRLQLSLQLGFPLPSSELQTQQTQLADWLTRQLGLQRCDVTINWRINSYGQPSTQPAIPGVRNIIAIASGKGGVGKSTSAVNVAVALAKLGVRVGLLDADIHGPNLPLMLGIQQRPEQVAEKKWQPIMQHGLQTMSIGYLLDPQTPTVWRGPMVSGALMQLLRDTVWDKCDYLLIDLPPGTGDVQLTLAQKVPLAGAVIVTTPQQVALQDATRAVAMFDKVKVPTLGVLENMSQHICTECGHQSYLFGQDGGHHLAQQYQVPLLAQLPLSVSIRQAGDAGLPMALQPETPAGSLYRAAALELTAQLSLQPVNYNNKLPPVKVQ